MLAKRLTLSQNKSEESEREHENTSTVEILFAVDCFVPVLAHFDKVASEPKSRGSAAAWETVANHAVRKELEAKGGAHFTGHLAYCPNLWNMRGASSGANEFDEEG